MYRRIIQRVLILGSLSGLLLQTPAASVDPRSPGQSDAESNAPHRSGPHRRILELEHEQETLLTQISQLPQYAPIALHSRFGYHSAFKNPGNRDQWIHWIANKPHQISAIALIPALEAGRSGPTSYAFPKRFKIEIRSSAESPFEPIVNWMDQDFPNPGPYPVFFSDINQPVQEIRITVSGGKPFALGEVCFFRYRTDPATSDNIASWFARRTDASNAFDVPGQWNVDYLSDRITGLGLPLSDKLGPSTDLLIDADQHPPADTIRFTLDLKKPDRVEHIDLWPALPPGQLLLPGLGFPRHIRLDYSLSPDFIPPDSSLPVDFDGDGLDGHPLTIRARGRRMQYIRITMTQLQSNQNFRCWGLGEIRVAGEKEILSTRCKIRTEGFPESCIDQLPKLIDGTRGGRQILDEFEWIRGLAKRRPLDQRLQRVQKQLGKSRLAWRRILIRSTYLGAIGAGLLLIGLLVTHRRLRKRALRHLRGQITSDLHDEVGSSLGSISMKVQQLGKTAKDNETRQNLETLALMAREACASLREVVWVIDQESIRLPELIQKLIERAEQVLSPMELDVKLPEKLPEQAISLNVKRHLTMFFKEAIHNCAKYAQATRLIINVSTNENALILQLTDNGRGFDTTIRARGWGLKNMEKRAMELYGAVDIASQPGTGTSITLTVPLDALAREPKKTYTTSN